MNVDAQIVGLVMIAVASLALSALVMWKHFRSSFWFMCALIAVSVGYLATTGVPQDLATWVFGHQPWLAVSAPEGAFVLLFGGVTPRRTFDPSCLPVVGSSEGNRPSAEGGNIDGDIPPPTALLSQLALTSPRGGGGQSVALSKMVRQTNV